MAYFNKGHGYCKIFLVPAIATLLLPSLAVTVKMDRATFSPVIIRGEGPNECPSEGMKQAALESIRHGIKKLLNITLPINDYCGPGEWQRAAYLNMTDPQQNCPSPWRELTDRVNNTIRGCGRVAKCSGNTFATGRQYSKVCGRIIAYQFATTDAFQTPHDTIDRPYVDGVSVTYGPI